MEEIKKCVFKEITYFLVLDIEKPLPTYFSYFDSFVPIFIHILATIFRNFMFGLIAIVFGQKDNFYLGYDTINRMNLLQIFHQIGYLSKNIF